MSLRRGGPESGTRPRRRAGAAAGARGQPRVGDAGHRVRADRLACLVTCALLFATLVLLERWLYELCELIGRVSFVISGDTPENVRAPVRSLRRSMRGRVRCRRGRAAAGRGVGVRRGRGRPRNTNLAASACSCSLRGKSPWGASASVGGTTSTGKPKSSRSTASPPVRSMQRVFASDSTTILAHLLRSIAVTRSRIANLSPTTTCGPTGASSPMTRDTFGDTNTATPWLGWCRSTEPTASSMRAINDAAARPCRTRLTFSTARSRSSASTAGS